MKKTFIPFIALVTVISFVKCGPAAEDRIKMHENAKRVSDSIARIIDASLAEGALPGTTTVTTINPSSTLEWNEVTKFKGNGMKKSSVFILTGKTARLKYKYQSPSNVGVFAVYVLNEGVDFSKSGGTSEIMTAKSEESESSIQKAAGRYYLNVNASGSWTVTVEEKN
jgi:hypothetical protein